MDMIDSFAEVPSDRVRLYEVRKQITKRDQEIRQLREEIERLQAKLAKREQEYERLQELHESGCAAAHVLIESGVIPGVTSKCRCEDCRLTARKMAEIGYLDDVKDRWWAMYHCPDCGHPCLDLAAGIPDTPLRLVCGNCYKAFCISEFSVEDT